MDPPGFEPGASALQGRRSPRLSYGPILSWSDRFDLVSDCHHKMLIRSKIRIFGVEENAQHFLNSEIIKFRMHTNTKVFDCFFVRR